jgi:hypothetical protein
MILLDLTAPFLSFFFRGKLFAALIALILQITIIGWIFASIWAILARRNARNERSLRLMEQQMAGQKNSES